METQLNYGNWIRKRILLILGMCAVGMGGLSLLPFGSLYQLVMAFLFVMTFISFLFPLYSYVMFSQSGGRIQDKVYTLIIEHLGSPITGRILDIGSGNGVLAVKLAQQHGEAEVVGMDYWGKDWEYSKGVCDRNAHIGGVEKRVHFQQGNAATLEFASDTFDGAVSNLTFHEVRSVADKREVVREALRVVKGGGCFAFVDYFYTAKHYGTAAEFENYLRSLNLSHFEIKPLREMIELPLLLRHPKILGQVGIVYGRK
jgi:SAM-dependent methyltransferase